MFPSEFEALKATARSDHRACAGILNDADGPTQHTEGVSDYRQDVSC
jgi:hypothetical protein